jgi:tRNA (mo5U34)-methyltransferase
MTTLTQKDIDEMNSINWFHSIKLSEEVTTPGKDNFSIFNIIDLPEDLSGKTVLDIGAWDGFYSFECEKRGAERVLATDEFVWKTWTGGTADRGFDFAHRILGSKVEKRKASVEYLRDNKIGEFDIVLMLGVLYHAPDPLGYLKAAFNHTREMLILETHVDLVELPYPAIAYYNGKSLADDPTNYWGPNEAAVVGMLKDVGFKDVKICPSKIQHQVDFHGRSAIHGRQAFHAYK